MSNPNPSPETRYRPGDGRKRGPGETIGAAIARCMCGLRKKSKGYIEAVASDETEKIYRRIAANRILAALGPKADAEFIMDYTSGLPSRNDNLNINATLAYQPPPVYDIPCPDDIRKRLAGAN